MYKDKEKIKLDLIPVSYLDELEREIVCGIPRCNFMEITWDLSQYRFV